MTLSANLLKWPLSFGLSFMSQGMLKGGFGDLGSASGLAHTASECEPAESTIYLHGTLEREIPDLVHLYRISQFNIGSLLPYYHSSHSSGPKTSFSAAGCIGVIRPSC